MSRAVLIAALGVAALCAGFIGTLAGAAPIPFPLPYLNNAVEILPIVGEAYGVDGKKVVGRSGTAGFLYDGQDFSVIQPPNAMAAIAFGISNNKVVGVYSDLDGAGHGFIYDGSKYTDFDLGAPYGIDGNKIVGAYADNFGDVHGFLYDGTTWTTLDHPLAARGTVARGIDGNNIVGTYITSLGRTRGFLFDGTNWTTLNDTFLTPSLIGDGTTVYDISGANIVGFVRGGIFSAPLIYDGSTFTHPALGLSGTVLTGISGNTIVGYYRDDLSGLSRPFIYTVPEPASLTLGAMGGLIFLAVAHRARRRRQR